MRIPYFVEIVRECMIEPNCSLRADNLRDSLSNVKRIYTNKWQLKKFTKNKVLRIKLKKDQESLCKQEKVIDNKSCAMCRCSFGKSALNALRKIS